MYEVGALHPYWPHEHNDDDLDIVSRRRHVEYADDDVYWQDLLSLDETDDGEPSSVIPIFLYVAVGFYCMFVVVNMIMWLTCEQRVEKVQLLHTPTSAAKSTKATRPYLIRISCLPMTGGSGDNFVQITLFGSEHVPEEFIVDIPTLNCVYLTHPTSSFLLHIRGAFAEIEQVRVMLASRNHGTQAWSLQYIDIRDVWGEGRWFFPGTPVCGSMLIGPEHPIAVMNLLRLSPNRRLHHGYFGRAFRRYHPLHIMAHSFVTQQIYGIIFVLLPFGFIFATALAYTKLLSSKSTWPATIGNLMLTNSIMAVFNAVLRILVRDCEELSLTHVHEEDEGKPFMESRLVAHDPNDHLHGQKIAHQDQGNHGRDKVDEGGDKDDGDDDEDDDNDDDGDEDDDQHRIRHPHSHPHHKPHHLPSHFPHHQPLPLRTMIHPHPKEHASPRSGSVSPISPRLGGGEIYDKKRPSSIKASETADGTRFPMGDVIILQFQPDTGIQLPLGRHCPVHGCAKHQSQQAAQTEQLLCVLSQTPDLLVRPVSPCSLANNLAATPCQLPVGTQSERPATACQNTVRFAPLPKVIQFSDPVIAPCPQPDLLQLPITSYANFLDTSGMSGSGDVYSVHSLHKNSNQRYIRTPTIPIHDRVKPIVFQPNGEISQVPDSKISASPNRQTQVDITGIEKNFSRPGNKRVSLFSQPDDRSPHVQLWTNNERVDNISNNRKYHDTSTTLEHMYVGNDARQVLKSSEVVLVRNESSTNTEPVGPLASETTHFPLYQRKFSPYQPNDNQVNRHGNYGSIIPCGQNVPQQGNDSHKVKIDRSWLARSTPENSVSDKHLALRQQQELDSWVSQQKQTRDILETSKHCDINHVSSSPNIVCTTTPATVNHCNSSRRNCIQVTDEKKEPLKNVSSLRDIANTVCKPPQVAEEPNAPVHTVSSLRDITNIGCEPTQIVQKESCSSAQRISLKTDVTLPSPGETLFMGDNHSKQLQSDWESLVLKCCGQSRQDGVLNSKDSLKSIPKTSYLKEEQYNRQPVISDNGQQKRGFVCTEHSSQRVIKHIKTATTLPKTTDPAQLNMNSARNSLVREAPAPTPYMALIKSNEGIDSAKSFPEVNTYHYAHKLVRSIVDAVEVDGVNQNNNAKQRHIDQCVSLLDKDATEFAHMELDTDSSTGTPMFPTSVYTNNCALLPRWVSGMLRRMKSKVDEILNSSRLERRTVFERIAGELKVDKSVLEKSLRKASVVNVHYSNQEELLHEVHSSRSMDQIWGTPTDASRGLFKVAVMKLVGRQCELQIREFVTEVVSTIYEISQCVLIKERQMGRIHRECCDPCRAHGHGSVSVKKNKLIYVLVRGLVFLMHSHANKSRVIRKDLSLIALEHIPGDDECCHKLDENKIRFAATVNENNQNINSNSRKSLHSTRSRRNSSIHRSSARGSIGKRSFTGPPDNAPQPAGIKDVIRTNDGSWVNVEVRIKELYNYVVHTLAEKEGVRSEPVALQAVAKTCILLHVLKQACRILLNECTCADKAIPSCLNNDLDGSISSYIGILQGAKRERGIFYLKVACLTVAERLKRNVNDHKSLLRGECVDGVRINVKESANDPTVHLTVVQSGSPYRLNFSNNQTDTGDSSHHGSRHHDAHHRHGNIHHDAHHRLGNRRHDAHHHHDNKHHYVHHHHDNKHHDAHHRLDNRHHDAQHHNENKHHDAHHHHDHKHHDVHHHHGNRHAGTREDYIINSVNACWAPIGPHILFISLLILLILLHFLTLYISSALTTRASWHCVLSVFIVLVVDLTVFQVCVVLVRAYIGSQSSTFDSVKFDW